MLTHTKVDFSDALNPSRELAALDQVLAQLPPRDRRLVAPVRDYARVLYRRTNWSPQRQVAFLHHFFRVDVPALDKRLRDECDVPLSKHIAPFSSAGSGA